VSLAAQTILTRHLRGAPEEASQGYWRDVDLDLSEATLIDWDMRDCAVRNAAFHKAVFTGNVWFTRARFNGLARFDEATLPDVANFIEAEFNGQAFFHDARFTGHAWFDEAVFRHQARFDRVHFDGDADFSQVNFADGACLEGAEFRGETRFGRAQVGARESR
jgi:uncharacterized protein YjbI with pentapeptide repeats